MSKLCRILITIFISLTVFNCKSQNLIANGSFENYTNTLNCYGGFDNYNATPIYHVLDNWYGFQSPDYFNAICPHSLIPGQYGYEVPANLIGYSQPKQGNAYTGIVVFNLGGYREYIYQHLSSPLIAGKSYCLSFFVTRTDRCQYAINRIGAYFSSNIPATVTNSFNINVIPQVMSQSGYISDTTQWTLIQDCFTALGGEQYITIGNFDANANIDTLFVGTNNPDPNYPGSGYNYSYYFIDDISLFDQTTVGIKSIESNNSFEIYPNPNTGLLKFSDLQYCKGDYNVKILDLFGKEIINQVLKEELDISSFDKGVYTLLLYKNKQLVVTKKVIKN